MIERQPYLPRFMAGGPGNPMGARPFISLVLSIAFTAPISPGQSVPRYRQALRLTNPDVADLYDRVPIGTVSLSYNHKNLGGPLN